MPRYAVTIHYQTVTDAGSYTAVATADTEDEATERVTAKLLADRRRSVLKIVGGDVCNIDIKLDT